MVRGAAPPPRRRWCLILGGGALKAGRPRPNRQPPAPPSLLPYLVPSHTPGEPAEGSSAYHLRGVAAKSGDRGGAGVRGSRTKLSGVNQPPPPPPNPQPQKDEDEETTLPGRECDFTPCRAPFPLRPPPLTQLPRAPSATHAHRKPAPCWISLKASAGVAFRCDGGAGLEQAEPGAGRCPGRGCCIASPVR